MSGDVEIITSPWGDFSRAVTSSDGTTLSYDCYYDTHEDGERGRPGITLCTPDADIARRLLPRVAEVFGDRAAWHRRSTDAIVGAFSDGEPSPEDLDDAVDDLVLDSIEVLPDAAVRLHLRDTCGEHFLDGYWPAVLFDHDDAVVRVTVEA